MRRRFFLLAAPAIVAAPSLMKVSALVMPPDTGIRIETIEELATYEGSFGELITTTLRKRIPRLIASIQQNNALVERLLQSGAVTEWQPGMQVVERHDW